MWRGYIHGLVDFLVAHWEPEFFQKGFGLLNIDALLTVSVVVLDKSWIHFALYVLLEHCFAEHDGLKIRWQLMLDGVFSSSCERLKVGVYVFKNILESLKILILRSDQSSDGC